MPNKFFTLSQITDRISAIISPVSNKEFWVKAEISNAKERIHLYCDLVETDSSNKTIAKITCTIWANDLANIRKKFADVGLEFKAESGIQIGLLCSLNFHSVYGLSLQAKDADPAVTLGQLEIEKQRIIKLLQSENLFEVNKKVYLNPLPNKIGLITGKDSAAYADFTKTISNSPYGISIYFADSHMQGVYSESSILKSLNLFDNSTVDLVVIARGGGSKSDLYSLDNEKIARRIVAMNKPVWTGIGHEIDTSVLDYVSNRSFKTPTAIAEQIISQYKYFNSFLSTAQKTFQTVWNKMLIAEKDFIKREVIGIKQGTRKLFQIKYSNLNSNQSLLSKKVTSRISTHNSALIKISSELKSVALSKTSNLRTKNVMNISKIKDFVKGKLTLNQNDLYNIKSRFNLPRFLTFISSFNYNLMTKRKSLIIRTKNRLRSNTKLLTNSIYRFTPNQFLKPVSNKKDYLYVIKSRFNLNRYLKNIKAQLSDLIDNSYKLLNQSKRIVKYKEKDFTAQLNRFSPHLILKPIENQKTILSKQTKLLNSYNPNNLLKKGYSILTNEEGTIVKSISQVKVGQIFVAELNDGKIKANINKKENKDG